jgi:signal transduction histidine kinase
MTRWHSTIRTRLTLHYAMAFFAAGAILIAVMLVFLHHVLDGEFTARIDAMAQVRDHLPAGLEQQLADRIAADRGHLLRLMGIATAIALVAVGLVATGIGWLMADRALRPLARITATARRVAERSLHERIALRGPQDEIKDLADTFDDMLARLDRSFDSQRRFVANASHELRTPLTLNRTLLEVNLEDPDLPEPTRQMATTLLAINRRHERLIDGLLTLATSDQAPDTRTRIDLAQVAQHVLAGSPPSTVTVHTDLQPAPTDGDPVLVERLVANLIDNAVHYNLDHDGHITIATSTEAGRAVLTIENTGPVIAAYEVPGLFEAFRRLPATDRQSSHGAGLGLSIVRAVARAHGGDADATPGEHGGLRVTIRLPALSSTA